MSSDADDSWPTARVASSFTGFPEEVDTAVGPIHPSGARDKRALAAEVGFKRCEDGIEAD
jgi:hypothetical protein